MNNRHPRHSCELRCTYHSSPMCMGNLVNLTGKISPISLGLRVGLTHAYRDKGLPPCVHVVKGAAYWSMEAAGRLSAVPQ